MTWKNHLRVFLGAAALGFAVFIVLACVLAVTSPTHWLEVLMQQGGIVWLILGVALYPVSRILLPERKA